MASQRRVFKVVTVGDEGIGKSAFLERIVENRFYDRPHKTIGVEFHLKNLEFQNTPCILQFWDFGTGNRFKFLLKTYLLGSKGAFLLFDLTNWSTLENIIDWIKILRKNIENIPIMILGTKSDLDSERKIEKDFIEYLVQKYNLVGFLEISSKSGYNTEAALTNLLPHLFVDVFPISSKEENVIIKAIELAIEISKKCETEDKRLPPKVGAVLIKNDKIIGSAYRGELNPGDHAEYTLLKQKLKGQEDFSDTTLITTLEPCTFRTPPKVPCADIIVKCGIKKVLIGVIDPNRDIRGSGIIWLQQHGVSVQLFEDKYLRKVIEINKPWWNGELKKYKTHLMAPYTVSINDLYIPQKNQQNSKKRREKQKEKEKGNQKQV